MENKELIDIANKLGINVTSHLNAIEDQEADKIRKGLKKKEEVKTTGPVIIRREVIVTEDEREKEKKKIEESKKKTSDLGFAQRRQKADRTQSDWECKRKYLCRIFEKVVSQRDRR